MDSSRCGGSLRKSECRVHKLVTDIIILAEGNVLLTRYKDVSRYDNQEGWFFPDDFLEFGEHPGDAAKRIAKEQVGLAVDDPTLSHVESFGDGAWHLVFHYAKPLPRLVPLMPGANVAEARWFPLDELPDREDVSHGGWAIDVLQVVLKRA